ncbi:hypothetical protein [Amycolatopsis orientalis]|uniref:hypothetical protein n=1 Tax=Amycolatopsis orientalis TaxID=31958 RepID=UPI001268D900|nr:hypothetical protein [Amycolatopsis orientalis]
MRMVHRSRTARATMVLVSALALTGAGAVQANAAEAATDRGAAPPCSTWNKDRVPTGRHSGWCDGNGPASYRFRVTCQGGGETPGQWRWLGDRRGSTAYCPNNRRGIGFSIEFD